MHKPLDAQAIETTTGSGAGMWRWYAACGYLVRILTATTGVVWVVGRCMAAVYGGGGVGMGCIWRGCMEEVHWRDPPGETAQAPPGAQVKPSEVDSSPSRVQVKPSEVESSPSQVQVKSESST